MVEDKEKKYIYIAFGLIILILLIVIILIWSPMFNGSKSISKKLTTIKLSTTEEYENIKKEEYKYVVKQLVNKENFENTIDLIDNEYMKKNNLNSKNIYNYLVDNNLLTNISNTSIVYNKSIKSDGKKYIYTYSYQVNNEEKLIHIIENYYNDYTISFDQENYPIINDKENIINIGNIQFKSSVVNSYSESILLKINIINNDTEQFVFDVNSLNSVYAKVKGDNIKYNLSSVVVGNETSSIVSLPGSTVEVYLNFKIPLEKQCYIDEICFSDIKKSNGESVSMNLLLN